MEFICIFSGSSGPPEITKEPASAAKSCYVLCFLILLGDKMLDTFDWQVSQLGHKRKCERVWKTCQAVWILTCENKNVVG